MNNDKTIIVTGHTGFKGSWLAVWLESLGARVIGVALEPPSKPSHFEVARLTEYLEDYRLDIRNSESIMNLVSNMNLDIF